MHPPLPPKQHTTDEDSTSLNVMFVSPPPPKTLAALRRSVTRAQGLCGLGQNWVNSTALEASIPAAARDLVVYRSLLQNDAVFSSEGLTLLALDHCFALKCALAGLPSPSSPVCDRYGYSYGYGYDSEEDDSCLGGGGGRPDGAGGRGRYDGAVNILRRLVYVSRGRPMTRGYLRQCYRCYAHSGGGGGGGGLGGDIPDSVLLRLNAEYEARFGSRGIVGVNDEYMGWRRDGLMWSAELEEYGRELAFSHSRSSSPTTSLRSAWSSSSSSDLEDKPLPELPVNHRDTLFEIFAPCSPVISVDGMTMF